MKYNTQITNQLADMLTPVSAYLRIRNVFSTSLLLESTDYHSSQNAKSFICCDPLSTFTVNSVQKDAANQLQDLLHTLQPHNQVSSVFNGLFGYTTFDAVQCFENIQFNARKKNDGIPLMRYDFFRFIIVINHFNDRLTIVENIPEGEESRQSTIQEILKQPVPQIASFKKEGNTRSNLTDQDFKAMVIQGKHHCKVGDVFQVVPSRRFTQSFEGDSFQVYRSLRSINPSPYLFYYDYEEFQVLGSSPEAQLVITNKVAEIHPIAGTFKRTGNDLDDAKKAAALLEDEKENAEHVMLVDLARNDLSIHTENVQVKNFKDVQYFSHVIHLVSKVTGHLKEDNAIQVFARTFPAGTLSGAPKYKALEIIDKLEPTARGFYGGAIGFFGFNGNINHAITIRSFLAKENKLHYQAGAGVVIGSNPEKENQEIYNKLGALGKALEEAEEL